MTQQLRSIQHGSGGGPQQRPTLGEIPDLAGVDHPVPVEVTRILAAAGEGVRAGDDIDGNPPRTTGSRLVGDLGGAVGVSAGTPQDEAAVSECFDRTARR